MKWMIASDIHGSAYWTRRLVARWKEEQPDRVILLGDLLYHGPRNPLPEGYEPPAVAKLLNDMADELLCVRGNCEAEVDQMVLHFPILSDSLIETLAQDYAFETWGRVDAGHQAIRLVTSWATPEEVVQEFVQDLHRLCAK